ncbi:MAG: hypothetical protein Q9186_004264 [Xanthomendoza sp. 1 TL-2023]
MLQPVISASQPHGLLRQIERCKQATRASGHVIKVRCQPCLNLYNSPDRPAASPGWLAVASKFIGPYLNGQTAAFYAQHPSQASFPTADVPPADPTETEDCLFLDVKVPRHLVEDKKLTGNRAPVLVWIHGGGYTLGFKSQSSSDSLLARSRTSKAPEAVFVQMNYRLGAFGFLSGAGVHANAGLLDQRLALEWVQNHIGQFGGDPRQVTVMGISAGAGSIEYHLTSRDESSSPPPLFQQAIMQSPFFFPDQGLVRNQARLRQLLDLAGVSSLAAAKAAPVEALRRAGYRIVLDAPYGQFGFDPWVLNDDDFTSYALKIFPGASQATISYLKTVVYPPPGSKSLPYMTNLDRAALLTSDVVFTCNTYLLGLAFQNKTFNYVFDVPPGLHGDDLHYTFGPDSSTRSERVRLAMQDYIISFATKGDPNSITQPPFPMYGFENQALDLSPSSIIPKPDAAASDRCLMLQRYVWS